MGIPKFFRFMSERYPLISQLIQENRIPEFDALYLDMNGIIHNCSHPNDNDASFRITEEAIFLAVFSYVSHLFATIKPQKLFFLAIDGVAPRAKMNQQRSRRFRTAKEMKETVEKAQRKGEVLPEGDGFDSNCITPGTPFMARLSAQLKYFIAKKISEDADWRNVEIVLSGHEVPGEGEHKIMEYIRLKKAQPGYDPNVRHCLYGLDADLIMLGLLSHDPHFCLLREEVTFGARGGKTKTKGVETQNFFLLHLSLFREYLDLEFSALKTASPPLPFEYDLERIIDDFILLNIFVGNDFLPHLPGLHINEGALGRLFDIYKRILPHAGGYLNEHGKLNVKRLQLVLDELTIFETEHFEHDFADSSWFKGKQTKPKQIDASRSKGKLVLSPEQREIFLTIKTFVSQPLDQLSSSPRLTMLNTFPARDRKFIEDIADQLRLDVAYDEFDMDGNNLVVLSFDQETLDLAEEDESTSDDSEEGSEWKAALDRVLTKYGKAEVAKPFDEAEWEAAQSKQFEEKMTEWKRDYYKEKLHFDPSHDAGALHDLAYRYIEGLQWVLSYYYSGVASWGWFYNYHYAPKISDLKNASSYTFSFDIGTPFHPFEQLMGVLPDLSSAHIPLAFRDLMSDPNSPIIDFYPVNFDLDLNGKKQDWEAIVQIPFIDEKRLLETMGRRASRLTTEERARNEFGDSWRFTYTDEESVYASSLPGFFPDLVHCHCKLEPFHLPTLEGGLSYVQGLVPGVLLGKDAISGFPSLHTVPHTGQLGFHGVNVFQTDSRKETMVVTLDSIYDDLTSEAIASLLIGKRTFVGYPYLFEAKVVAISDELFRYGIQHIQGRDVVVPTPHSGGSLIAFKRSADRLEHTYSKKHGCIIGPVHQLIHVQPLKGLTRMLDGATVKEYEDEEVEYAVQSSVADVSSEDVRYMEQPPIPVNLEFPEGCKVFFLAEAAYGIPATVISHRDETLSIWIAYFPNDKQEPQIFKQRLASALQVNYVPSHAVARQVRMSGLALSKLCSSMMVNHGDGKANIGLNLKFEAKALKVLGYSQKGVSGWEFSPKAIALIQDYNANFPEVAARLDQGGNRDLTQARDIFGDDAEERLKELKSWLVKQGVRDFDKVPLYSEQLEKETVQALEQLADRLGSQKVPGALKKAAIQSIPRAALLKPAHTSTRLRDQHFSLGDRVIQVSESGSIPLSAKGVVVGIQTGFIDVVFDVPFMGGSTLGDRCSPHRGQSVIPTSILNLSDPQSVTMTHPPPSQRPTVAGRGRGASNAHFKTGPRGGPAILPAHGLPAAGFHPAPPQNSRGRGAFANGGVKVMQNPSRQFDNNYRAAARGEPQISAPTPESFTQLQSLGAALGIPVSRSAPPPRGGGQPRGGFRGVPMAQPTLTPAHRGAMGGGFVGSSRGRAGGVAIPPPAVLTQQSQPARGRGGAPGRGRGRGGPQGGRGASAPKAGPVMTA